MKSMKSMTDRPAELAAMDYPGAARSLERAAAAAAFYGALAEHPDASRRVGWESGAQHALRLHAIVEALSPFAGAADSGWPAIDSLIDVGCGEAALLAVLRRGGFAGHYRGEDVRAAPVARSQAVADADAHAEVVRCDGFLGSDASPVPLPKAHAVVCSGALNTVSGEGIDHDVEVCTVLSALWQRTEAVLVVDLAVRDRHAPGVGLASADLAKVWAHARTLTPIVTVREDTVPGEACLILSRSRAAAYGRRMSGEGRDILRAEALLQAGEPTAALAIVVADERAQALLIAGQALAATGRVHDALTTLRRAAVMAEAEGDDVRSAAARLAQAPALWRLGDRRAAETLLVALAQHDDEARGHLFELLLARKEHARAAAVAASVDDLWMRRELEARLARLARLPLR